MAFCLAILAYVYHQQSVGYYNTGPKFSQSSLSRKLSMYVCGFINCLHVQTRKLILQAVVFDFPKLLLTDYIC